VITDEVEKAARDLGLAAAEDFNKRLRGL
jgi:hypothetical protein